MKKILVTGASGFVGSRVVAAMKDGFELLTPSHGAFDITSASSVDEYITRHRPEAICIWLPFPIRGTASSIPTRAIVSMCLASKILLRLLLAMM